VEAALDQQTPKKGPPPAAFWIAIGVAIGCGLGVALRNPLLVGGTLLSRRKP
jgi:hypothetical protein